MSDEKPRPGMNIIRSPVYREIYANLLSPRINLYDLGVTFGSLTSRPGSPNLDTVVEEIHVTMAYGEAKYLIAALSSAIKAYEDEFGPVPTQTLHPDTDEISRKTIESLKANRLQRGTTV
jgi:hypothetical protein